MKLDEIPCVLSIEERIRLVDDLIRGLEAGTITYICIYIAEHIYLSQDIYDRICKVFGVVTDSLSDKIITPVVVLLAFGGYEGLIEDKHYKVYRANNEGSYTGDDSASYIKLKLCLPELLEYEPTTLDYRGGYWDEDDKKSRIKALSEIKEKLISRLNEQ